MRLLTNEEVKKVITRVNNLQKKVPDIWDYYTGGNDEKYIIERCKNKGRKYDIDEIPFICDGAVHELCGDCKGRLVLETSEHTEDVAKLITYYKNVTPVLANMIDYLLKYGAFFYWKKFNDEKPPIDTQIELYVDRKRYLGFLAHDGALYDMNYKKIDINDFENVWWTEKLTPPEDLADNAN